MSSVLVAAVYSDELFEELRRQFPDQRMFRLPHGGEVPPEAADASALLWCSDTNESLLRTLSMAPNLKWIHSCTAGLDQLWDPEVEKRGIIVTRSPVTSHIPVSEWAMACVLTMAKQLPQLRDLQARRTWGEPDPIELWGSTMGIVGTGFIGREIAHRAKAFGMTTIGLRRRQEALPDFDEVYGSDGLHHVLSRSDFVVLCCPLNGQTRGMIGWDEFQVMKAGAYLINVSRGEVIVEDSLVKALEGGVIAGAALDVFPTEPLAADSQLWGLPNVIITPHAAWRSPKVRNRGICEFAANLRRFLEGRQLLNVVDPAEFS